MSVKLLTKHHFEFLSLKGGCSGSSESTLVKMPHCWKSHVMAQLFFFLLTIIACRVILDYNVDDINEAMKTLKIMTVYDQFYLRKAKFMFKVYNN